MPYLTLNNVTVDLDNIRRVIAIGKEVRIEYRGEEKPLSLFWDTDEAAKSVSREIAVALDSIFPMTKEQLDELNKQIALDRTNAAQKRAKAIADHALTERLLDSNKGGLLA